MDWTQSLTIILTILGICVGGFLYLSSKIDKIREDLYKEISNCRDDLSNIRNDLYKEIYKNREEILWIKFRLDPNEHPRWKREEKEILEVEEK